MAKSKQSTKKKKKELTPQDILKYEIAEELGLMEKVNKLGWGGLTARETGRIGGIMTSKKKAKQKIDEK
jgi:hypothetical protein